MQYATNTSEKVIKLGDAYYLCLQGVWSLSTTAQRPWQTAPTVPPEIHTIPPSSPVYNVTYVTQTTLPTGEIIRLTSAIIPAIMDILTNTPHPIPTALRLITIRRPEDMVSRR